MKNFVSVLFCAGLAVCVKAALPQAVIEACLSPSISEYTSGQVWTIMTAEAWDNGSMFITESKEASTFTEIGKPHPMNWAKTEVTLVQPNPGAERPESEQKLTLSLIAQGVVPHLEVEVKLIDNAVLPPCEVVRYKDRLAIVSKQKDWYILADDASMTITQTDETPVRTTLTYPKTKVEKFRKLSVSTYVGEGSLPQ